jgi:plastocyanin
MGKIIAGIIIVLVIIVGGWYFWQKGNASYVPPKTSAPSISNQNTPAPPAVQPVQTNMVSYTDQSFSPKEITVKVGTTVTWTNNNAGKQMWVASAPHPVHTDYPGFDAKQASAAGGTYSFTFDKVGDWKYHNHMNPTDFGIVHVTQ